MLHIVPMACRCAWHQLCETWPKRFRAMPPFTKFLYFFITCGKAGIGGIPITFSNSSSIRSVVLSFVNFLCLFFAEFCQFSVFFLCRVLSIFCVFSLQSFVNFLCLFFAVKRKRRRLRYWQRCWSLVQPRQRCC